MDNGVPRRGCECGPITQSIGARESGLVTSLEGEMKMGKKKKGERRVHGGFLRYAC
jgi:hypothetical protein